MGDCSAVVGQYDMQARDLGPAPLDLCWRGAAVARPAKVPAPDHTPPRRTFAASTSPPWLGMHLSTLLVSHLTFPSLLQVCPDAQLDDFHRGIFPVIPASHNSCLPLTNTLQTRLRGSQNHREWHRLNSVLIRGTTCSMTAKRSFMSVQMVSPPLGGGYLDRLCDIHCQISAS